MSRKQAKVALKVVPVVSLLLALPSTARYGLRSVTLDGLTIRGRDCSVADNMRGSAFPVIYTTILFLLFFLSLGVLSAMYTLIWRELRRHKNYLLTTSRYSSTASPVHSPEVVYRHSCGGEDPCMDGPRHHEAGNSLAYKSTVIDERDLAIPERASDAEGIDRVVNHVFLADDRVGSDASSPVDVKGVKHRSDTSDWVAKPTSHITDGALKRTSPEEDGAVHCKSYTHHTVGNYTSSPDDRSVKRISEGSDRAVRYMSDIDNTDDRVVNDMSPRDDRDVSGTSKKDDTAIKYTPPGSNTAEEYSSNAGCDTLDKRSSKRHSGEVPPQHVRDICRTMSESDSNKGDSLLGDRLVMTPGEAGIANGKAEARITRPADVGAAKSNTCRGVPQEGWDLQSADAARDIILHKHLNRSTILTAMTITAVFFLSFVPHKVLMVIRAVNQDLDTTLQGVEFVMFHIFLRSYFVNCVVNPFIYAALNTRFRTECRRLFRQICQCCRSDA